MFLSHRIKALWKSAHSGQLSTTVTVNWIECPVENSNSLLLIRSVMCHWVHCEPHCYLINYMVLIIIHEIYNWKYFVAARLTYARITAFSVIPKHIICIFITSPCFTFQLKNLVYCSEMNIHWLICHYMHIC